MAEQNNVAGDVGTGSLPVHSYKYDLSGRLDKTLSANGLIHDYGYDSLGRLYELYHWVDLDSEPDVDAQVRSSVNNDLLTAFGYPVGVAFGIGPVELREIKLSPWPVKRSPRWIERVNQALTEKEVKALRNCFQHGRPFETDKWVEATAKKQVRELTLRPRGRSKKLS